MLNKVQNSKSVVVNMKMPLNSSFEFPVHKLGSKLLTFQHEC